MKTTALRLYGANDLRLEEFELPDIREDEILAEVISDSICMSTYKCATLGTKHKRVPDNVAEKPIILGHEFAGNILKVGKKHQQDFQPGMKFTVQPALNYKGSMWSPGYSYPYFGGNATRIIIPKEVMELGCLLEYKGEAYFEASLAEPMSCSIGAFNANYHTDMGVYHHQMGIRENGKMAILAGAGPMGLGMIDYALHGDRRPSVLVVTDIDQDRLEKAKQIFSFKAWVQNIDLHFINPRLIDDPVGEMMRLSNGGFDDVFVYASVREVLHMASDILGRDGCLNFFAGPLDSKFRAELNYYDVHYNATHVIGTTGGNTDDMRESLRLTAEERINPAIMVSHVGGLNSAKDAILNLPSIPGGKKLIYNHIDMPLTAISDFSKLGGKDRRFAVLGRILKAYEGLWSAEAESYLLSNWMQTKPRI